VLRESEYWKGQELVRTLDALYRKIAELYECESGVQIADKRVQQVEW
jgi:hypothetical protein